MRSLTVLALLSLIALPGLALAQNADAPAPSAAAASAAAAAATSTPAITPKPLSDAERAAIEQVIKDYLTKEHPEVMVEGMQELQRRDQASAETKSREAVNESKDKIFNDPTTPVGGNPKGDITIVEFYDYQCGYCKMSEPAIEQLLKDDKNVRLIYKDFPILGPMSVEASKASFAAAKQGKFQAFHDALMNKKDHVSDDLLYQTAKDVGLDVDKLKKDMAGDDIAKQIEDNLKLGNDIGVRGTPMFLIGGGVYPGALTLDQFKKDIADQRANKKM